MFNLDRKSVEDRDFLESSDINIQGVGRGSTTMKMINFCYLKVKNKVNRIQGLYPRAKQYSKVQLEDRCSSFTFRSIHVLADKTHRYL